MLSAFSNSLKIPELRQRIFFTFGLVFIARVIATIPIPGVDIDALRGLVASLQRSAGGGLMGLYDMFSGGALANIAVGALGIMPYISASIILQLMTAVVPSLGKLAREGDVGRQKIIQYTRYLTVILCIVQGWAISYALLSPASLGMGEGSRIVYMNGSGFVMLAVMTMTAGSMLLMWLGEQITARGIGNGVSLIITVNIVNSLPTAVKQMIAMFRTGGQFNPFLLVALLAMMFVVIAVVIAVTQAQRRIPVQYAKRVVGRKVYGGQSTYMPLRVNYSGVMPIIFAQSILMFPPRILKMMGAPETAAMIDYGTSFYTVSYTLMILFFSYFWVATQFNPIQIADDLKKYGGYVPGIRPGTPTAEFLDFTMTRITLAGAIFLTVIAVLPSLLMRKMNVPWIVAQFFGGTSILITVGVMLDTMRQVESHLLMRHYDGFLKKGKLRSRR